MALLTFVYNGLVNHMAVRGKVGKKSMEHVVAFVQSGPLFSTSLDIDFQVEETSKVYDGEEVGRFSGKEEDVMYSVFLALRDAPHSIQVGCHSGVIAHFAQIYNFLSRSSNGLRSFSETVLRKKWGSMRTQSSRENKHSSKENKQHQNQENLQPISTQLASAETFAEKAVEPGESVVTFVRSRMTKMTSCLSKVPK